METAIEWYHNEMVKFEKGNSEFFSSAAIYNHAFRMEKEHIEIAFDLGRDEVTSAFIIDGEDYYNKKFNQKKIMKLTYDWQKYDGDYQKKIQDIKLKNGDIVMACYPNAGLWNCLDSKSPYYEKEIHHLSAELVRLNAEHNKPFENPKK